MEETPTLDNQESSVPEESEETLNTEEVVEEEAPTGETPEEAPAVDKFEELYKNQKIRAEKAETERKALEEKLNKKPDVDKTDKTALDVEDYIDISASLEGLDQREKERLAKEHKLTGRSLQEIRQDEDFVLWQEAYRNKVEKEQQALAPTGTQGEADKPTDLLSRLANATQAEKAKILEEEGLWKSPRPRADRTPIGDGLGN